MPLVTSGGSCPICKRPFYREEYSGGYTEEGCSDFCATQDDAVRLQFAQLKPGDWGVYPCAECGCAVDDLYEVGSICSKCVHPRNSRVRGELLREALPHLPPALAKRVQAELDGEKLPEVEAPARFERAEPV